jgi:1-acyl-sn-glycerol-3-phosphate acyltransferase
MIRALWLCLTALVMTAWHGGRVIVASFAGVPYEPRGFYDREQAAWGRRLLRLNGARLRVEGLERLEQSGAYVFVANHASLVDIWALLAAVPQSVKFLAKRELLHWPLFGRVLRAAGHLPIDRGDMRHAVAAYDEAAAKIRLGTSAAVFAEGTRTTTGDLLAFKRGPFVLAIRAGVPVVPVWIGGTFGMLPRGSLRFRPGEVVVRLGEPMPTAHLSHDDRERLAQEARGAVARLAAGSGERGTGSGAAGSRVPA